MLSVNRMLNTEQEHQYQATPIYSTSTCQSMPPSPPLRSSMLDIANLLCRDDDEDDNNSQLTTPCLSVTSSPIPSHPPSFINLSNLQSNLEYEDPSSTVLTPPLRSSPYCHHSSLSADTLHDYHYQHRLMFTTGEDHSVKSDNTTTDIEEKGANIIKTKRRRATNKQLQVLQSVFEHTFFPSTHVRSQLGRQLGMSPRTVQIWFQNRRQALRTKEKRNGVL